MGLCFVPDCNHRHVNGCSFFSFPRNEKLKKQWLKLIRRADVEPTRNNRVCSCHFPNQDVSKLPTLFARNEGKHFSFKSPESRKKRGIGRRKLQFVCEDETSSQDLVQENTEVVNDPLLNETSKISDFECKKLKSELATARHQVELLKLQNRELTEKCKKLEQTTFCWENMKMNEKSIIFHTGLPSANVFELVVSIFDDIEINYYYEWQVTKFSRSDQILITLIKLRQNIPHFTLAQMFRCSISTISNIVTTWIYLFHEILFKKFMQNIPSRVKNQACLPSCFNDFSSCRLVMDCTEITIAIPEKIDAQRLTWSGYKQRNTGKGLVAVAPNGVVTYVSAIYPGGTSDKEIVRDSGILRHLQAGDLVLADKGFLIKDLLPDDVAFNMPPFLSMPQFTPSEIMATKSIARARIHIERAIKRIKSFKILSMIPPYLREHASVIFQTCAALTNLQNPLISEVEYLYKPVS